MTKVDFYKVEVSYSGRFEDYTKNDFFEMARERTYHGVDATWKEEETPEDESKQLDGEVNVIDKYPSNKIAEVTWSYIREEKEE